NEEKTIEQNTTTESFENRIRNQNITNENIETSNVEQAVKNAKHSIAEANFTLDNIKGCAPLLVKFKNQSKNAKSYLWEFGNGDISVKKNPTYTFTEAGNYTVTLTAQSKDGSNITFTKDITVLPSPIAEFNIDIDESDIKTRKIVFRNNSKDASKYYWEFGDKKSAEDEQPNHVYSDYKPYKVKLTTISKDGCSDTAVLVNKFIEKNYALSFPNSFHPSAGGPGNSGYYGSMGENSSIFFPNNNGASEYSLRIKTPHGIEVFNTNNIEQGWNGYIRGRIAPAGVYSYTAKGTYPNGQSFEINGQVKVVVQNVYDYYQ
ncbi:MAG: PKD domain-containing protein, partial [Bacteroidales bacterium]|nr:PKD domain-containing protein [Bacteroidales bacterium]